jgi:adenosylcobinamide-GDP ribazoletransferase
LNNYYDQLAFTLRFFTRLPIPGVANHEGDLAARAVWFPVAGLVIGILSGIVWLIACAFFPALPAAGLALGFSILVTGALHEDGFADCADGLGGGHTRERALEIMRDSRIGAYGAIALILTIGLRWSALASLGIWPGFWALIIAHCVSRAAITLPLAHSRYARKDGLGASVAEGISSSTFIGIIAVFALVALTAGGIGGILAAAIAFAAAWAFMKYLESRLGGYTGDGLGAIQQIAEMAVLLTLAASLT